MVQPPVLQRQLYRLNRHVVLQQQHLSVHNAHMPPGI
jgi:hypothetical protein